jgi:hypothetical protein
MESRNQRVWIVVFVVVALACLAAIAAIALGVAWFFPVARESVSIGAGEGARIEETFNVGSSPRLELDNFAGSVTVEAGESGVIQVVATKRALRAADLDRIVIERSPTDGGLLIRTRKPATLLSASVDFQITVPADTRLRLDTGAGSVEVRGLSGDVDVDTGSGSVELEDISAAVDAQSGSGNMTVRGSAGPVRLDTGSGSIEVEDTAGDLDAHTGSGSIRVRDASGRARLDTGSGSIRYQGSPSGECRFETGSGSITLELPDDLSVEIDLATGSGDIDVQFDVAGQVRKREVKGTIGDGSQGSIDAQTGSGDIDVIRR